MKIQLCGSLLVRIGGERIDDRLPGAQGRLLFGYLVLNRGRAHSRPELIDAIWGETLPSAPETALRALLSKLRAAIGAEHVEGKNEIRLVLPPGASVDRERALQAIHNADAAVAQEQWQRAWISAHVATNTARRPFMAGHDADWVNEERREMESVHARGLEALAAAGVGIGGPELDLAERAARQLVRTSPYRESGHRLLMEVLAAQGNVAEALLVYERIRERLRDELGITPSPPLQATHSALLGGTG